MTLVEIIIVLALAGLMITATAAYSVDWVAKESMRSTSHDVQSIMQLARVEAISRNRECRFVVHPDAGTIHVYDGMGTSVTTDDTELRSRNLPEVVRFARPDAGAVITISPIGATTSYETVFTPDGAVSVGIGSVHLFGGNRYGRVSVFGAGAIQTEHWGGSSWVTGS